MDAYRKILEIDPNNFEARSNYASLLDRYGEYESAEKEYKFVA